MPLRHPDFIRGTDKASVAVPNLQELAERRAVSADFFLKRLRFVSVRSQTLRRV
jgi:hypothetical protein